MKELFKKTILCLLVFYNLIFCYNGQLIIDECASCESLQVFYDVYVGIDKPIVNYVPQDFCNCSSKINESLTNSSANQKMNCEYSDNYDTKYIFATHWLQCIMNAEYRKIKHRVNLFTTCTNITTQTINENIYNIGTLNCFYKLF